MHYLVQMNVTDAGRPTTLPEGLAFIEQYIAPSLELCKQWQSERKVVAGGPVGGSLEIAMIVEAGSIEQLDELLETLPIWPRMHTTVKQLIAFDERLTNVRHRAERVKSKMGAA
jgi:hypothetical protein